VTVVYHTFFLNEGLPPEGADFRNYMTQKVGGHIPLEVMFDGPRRAGAVVGLQFNFEAITRAPNTLRSHCLIAVAPEAQRPAVIEALYAAYFDDGQDIGQAQVLSQVGRKVGLAEESIQRALHDEELAASLFEEAHYAQQSGITGVPFFILNHKLAFSGAQPPVLILKALKQAATMP
jgi:predicted DsbA family dithiol-disulfide isomerase